MRWDMRWDARPVLIHGKPSPEGTYKGIRKIDLMIVREDQMRVRRRKLELFSTLKVNRISFALILRHIDVSSEQKLVVNGP